MKEVGDEKTSYKKNHSYWNLLFELEILMLNSNWRALQNSIAPTLGTLTWTATSDDTETAGAKSTTLAAHLLER